MRRSTVIAGVSKALGDGKIESGASLELSENVDASERAILLDLRADARERGRWDGLLGVAGASGVAIARGRPTRGRRRRPGGARRR